MELTDLVIDKAESSDLGLPRTDLAKIKVIGVGGGGGNAINNMIASGLSGVSFIAANTEAQDLGLSLAKHKVQLGAKLTRGLGAGGNPRVGCEAAMESEEQLRQVIEGANMVFVTAGMGGGTGTGAAPVIARIAKELGILTVGVVTKPFFWEGPRRRDAAQNGIEEFSQHVDSLITIPNDRLVAIAPRNAPIVDMLKKADDVLLYAVKGISELITNPGYISLDFADVKTAMGDAGLAMMGTGSAKGESRAREAAMQAISSPLLEDVSIEGARHVLMNVTANRTLQLDEVTEAATIVTEGTHHDQAYVFFGMVIDENMDDELRITVIATGIERAQDRLLNPIVQGGKNTVLRGGQSALPPKPILGNTAQPRFPVGFDEVSPELQDRVRRRLGESAPEDNSFQPAKAKWHNQGSTQVQRQAPHSPGEDSFIFDEDEEMIDVPSFIRRQAN
ncbi:MAG: cell division protein FtsZ [Desulfovibrio sp.]|jgi:cell division protein FtsZ|nr:cell division protein FtsZ [Desulfovibrio sp.]